MIKKFLVEIRVDELDEKDMDKVRDLISQSISEKLFIDEDVSFSVVLIERG